MQPSNATQAADSYLTWQDLLEAEDALADTAGDQPIADPATAAGGDDSWAPAAPVQLPPDVEALLAEKARLEDELKRLTGMGEPKPEDERMKRMYPVKVHTKESRIEERRLRRHDEQQRLLKQRLLEAKRAQAREAQRQAELEADRRRKAVEQALAKVHAQLREAELAEEQRRKAVERTQAELRAAQRQAELEADRQRKAHEQALVQARWANDRQKALLKGAQARRQAALEQAQAFDELRARTAETARLRKIEQAAMSTAVAQIHKTEQQADLQKIKAQEVDRWAKAQAPSIVGMDAPAGASIGARTAALDRFQQKKNQALAWEQAQERLRQQALDRRREEQMLAERLDRRGKKSERFASAA